MNGPLERDGKSMGLVAVWLSFAHVSVLSTTKEKGLVIKFLLLNQVFSENAAGADLMVGTYKIGPLSKSRKPFSISTLLGLWC